MSTPESVELVRNKKGRPMATSVCSECGAKKSRIISESEAAK